MEPAQPFLIKARHLSILFVALVLLLPVAVVIGIVIDYQPYAEHWESLLGQSYLTAAMGLTLVCLLIAHEVNWRKTLSRPANGQRVLRSLLPNPFKQFWRLVIRPLLGYRRRRYPRY